MRRPTIKGGGTEFGHWFAYWQEGFKHSKERHEMIVLLLAGLLKLAGMWAKSSSNSDSFAQYIDPTFIDFISNWVAGGLAVYGLLWVPFRMHEVQEAKHREALAGLQTENQTLKQTAISSSRQELLADGERLRQGIETRRKQGLKNELGTFLRIIEKRILEVNSQNITQYVNASGPKDEKSEKIILEIEAFLESHLGVSDAAMFKSLSDITYSASLKDHVLPQPFEILSRSRKNLLGHSHLHDWQATKDVLNHYARNLKVIIRKLD